MIRPQSNPLVLVCALAGALLGACDNGDSHLVTGSPGAGGARAGAGGSIPATGGAGGSTPATGGAGGSLSSGGGGNISTGAGGNISTGAGGNVSTGAGGNVSTGVGGSLGGAGGRGGAAGSGSGGTAGGGGGNSAGGRSGSSGARCGNGVRDLELFERCDGEDLGGETCQSLRGFASGTIRCSSSCLFDTSACSACSQDPVVLSCGVKPADLSPFAVAMGSNGTEVALAWAASADTTAGGAKIRLTRLDAALATLSTVRVNEPGILAAGYGGSNSFAVAPLPSGWVVAGMGLSNLFVHTFDAAGANVGRITVNGTNVDLASRVAVIPRPDGGPLLFWETTETTDPVSHLHAAVISADGASTTAPVEVPSGAGYVSEIGRGTYADGQFYVPFTTEPVTDGAMYREGHLQIARVANTGTLSGVADPLPGIDVHTPALTAAGGQLALSYKGTVDGSPTSDPNGPRALLSLRLALSGAAASSAPPLVLGDRAAQAALLTVGDAVVQLLDESKLTLGTYYPGESLELVRVPAAGPLGEKHQLMAAGDLPYWSWLDAVSVGSDVVVGWVSGGETPLQLIRARP